MDFFSESQLRMMETLIECINRKVKEFIDDLDQKYNTDGTTDKYKSQCEEYIKTFRNFDLDRTKFLEKVHEAEQKVRDYDAKPYISKNSQKLHELRFNAKNLERELNDKFDRVGSGPKVPIKPNYSLENLHFWYQDTVRVEFLEIRRLKGGEDSSNKRCSWCKTYLTYASSCYHKTIRPGYYPKLSGELRVPVTLCETCLTRYDEDIGKILQNQ